MFSLSRRTLIRSAAALALASIARPVLAQSLLEKKPRFLDYPFKLGVASGDPVTDGVVLWTRLAPDPFEPLAMPAEPVIVDWAVAEDARMGKTVQTGRAIAHPEHAFAVHAEVRGLRPGRDYFYRFTVGSEESPIGRTRTAPLPNIALDRFRFAFASCQQYEMGYFAAYRDMAAQAPDLVVHLGDYIYEQPWTSGVRRHPWTEAVDLAGYRAYHALYKLDPDLQAAHAAAPWLMTWDDHEVDNDYAADQSQNYDEQRAFLLRRAAAYKAYFEHMPLRRIATPQGPNAQLYHQARFGDLVAFNVLDGRQYRSDQPCQLREFGGGRVVRVPECRGIDDPSHTMFGAAQERWLFRNLARAETRWNVLAQQLLFAPFDQGTGPEPAVYTDSWGGYPAARQRLIDHIAAVRPSNPVFIGGDIHSYWVTDIKHDSADPESETVASEFVGSSITSPLDVHAQFTAAVPRNPHVKYFEGTRRGYCLCTLTSERWQSDLRAVDDVLSPDSATNTLKSFVIESGRPGAVEA